MSRISTLALATILTSLTSCASVLSGGKDIASINSTVEGVRIFIDGELRGTTSVSASLKRGHGDHTIRVEHDDYLPFESKLDESFDARTLLGIFIDFGIITIPLDFLSGNIMGLSPTDYTVKVEDGRLVLDSDVARRQRKLEEEKKQREAQGAPTKNWGGSAGGGTLGRS